MQQHQSGPADEVIVQNKSGEELLPGLLSRLAGGGITQE